MTAALAKFLITTEGFVGIGTTNPQYGRFQVDQLTDSAASGISVLNSTGARSGRFWVDDTKTFIDSGGSGTAELILNTGGGNIGMGTTVPAESLDVRGDILAEGYKGPQTTVYHSAFNVTNASSKVYVPLVGSLVDSSTGGEQSKMVMPYAGRLKTVHLRMAGFNVAGPAFSNVYITFHKASDGSPSATSVTESETLSCIATETTYTAIFSSSTFTAGQIISIGMQTFDTSIVPGDTILTIVVEYDIDD